MFSLVSFGELEEVDEFAMLVGWPPLPTEEVGEALDLGLVAYPVVEPVIQALHLIPGAHVAAAGR